jgi:hypothetical protein
VGDVDETKSVLPMTGNEVRIERHFIFHPLPHGIQDALLDPRPTQLMRSVLKSVQVLLIEIQIPCLKMITSNLTSEFGFWQTHPPAPVVNRGPGCGVHGGNFPARADDDAWRFFTQIEPRLWVQLGPKRILKMIEPQDHGREGTRKLLHGKPDGIEILNSALGYELSTVEAEDAAIESFSGYERGNRTTAAGQPIDEPQGDFLLAGHGQAAEGVAESLEAWEGWRWFLFAEVF